MSIVLDSSVAIAWMMPDEKSVAIDRIFNVINREGALVPSLWWTEVANTLSLSKRRGRIDQETMIQSMLDMAQFFIETDNATVAHAWGSTLELAQQYRLTCYDATYLELAMRTSARLATFDRELAAAAKEAGVRVL